MIVQMIDNKKGVGLNPNTYIHLTDHLAPICVIMGIPLLLTNEEHCEEVKKLYPQLQTLLINWEELTPRYLIDHFDVLFQSEVWPRSNFYSIFQYLEEEYQKTIRNVHCPHGFSDKVFWLKHCAEEDITLVYGNNMLDMLREMNVAEHLNTYVRSGNYRYTYYLQHQSFFDRLIEDQVTSRFSAKQPTILYAPTCNDVEENTSFLNADPIFQYLPDSYNLIVKLHPRLEETNAPAVYRTIGRYAKKKNIVFLKDFPLVYPILACSDIYIGDASSIGYDYLVFNRPMFFLNQKKRDFMRDRNSFIFRCGTEILPDSYQHIYSKIEQHLINDHEQFGNIRQKTYHYTFDDNVSFDDLKTRIIMAYNSPKKME